MIDIVSKKEEMRQAHNIHKMQQKQNVKEYYKRLEAIKTMRSTYTPPITQMATFKI